MQKQIKTLKRILSVVLALAVLASTVIITTVIPTAVATGSDGDAGTVYPFYRNIDFSKYKEKAGTNCWYQNSTSEPYWTQRTDDATADGGAYIRYDSSKKAGSWWEGNHVFVPSETGAVTDITLPTSTTFRATLRLRAVNLSNATNGIKPFVIYGSSVSAANSGSAVASYSKLTSITDADAVLTASDTEWTEISFTFTTPSEYTGPEGGAVYDKCFIGFYPGSAVVYSYDIDSLRLVAVNNADTRVVDFADYVPKVGVNAWGPSAGENANPTETWTSVVADSSALGGAYLNFDGKVNTENVAAGMSGWYGHYNLNLTNDGTATDTGDMTDGANIVLPNSTTYRLTVRARLNKVAGNTKLYTTYSAGRTTCNEETVIAENLTVGDWKEYSIIFTTPEAYTVSGTSTYNKFYFGFYNGGAGDLNYDIDYAVLEKVETVNITFDANGGAFGEETTATEVQVIGDAPKAATTLSAPGRSYVLSGWSTAADSTELVTEITESMDGTTLYAVWNSDPHAGGYNSESIVISGLGYTVSSSSSYTFNNGTSTVYYWTNTPVADSTTEDGYYLRYEATNGQASNWLGNHAMALSPTGTPTELPTATTYEMTIRLRTKSIPASGIYPFIAYCDQVGRGYTSFEECQTITFTDKIVHDTNGEWTTLTLIFTTPDEYLTYYTYNEDGSVKKSYYYNKCFFGFYTGTSRVDYSYDIDTITMEVRSNTSFYVDSEGDGTFELYNTVTGAPGADLTLPSATEIKEVYNSDGTGYTETYNFSDWYSGEACTEKAILKFGNFDVDLYCKPTVTVSSAEGQLAFVGFDSYTEIAPGMSYDASKAELTDAAAMTGTTSMKTTLKAGESTSFEIKNDYAIELLKGKTYRITLNYKTDAAVNLGVGIGDAGDIPATAVAFAAENVSATDEWKTASFLMDADSAENYLRGYAPAVVINASNDANVYVDNMAVYTVTDAVKAVKTDNGLRFMMTYNCGGDDTVVMGADSYKVSEHGILVTGADNTTALKLENADTNGVMKVSADTDTYYSRNSVTGATVYSVLLEGLTSDDTYGFSAKGYVKFENGDIYYSNIITSSVATAEEPFELVIPAENIDVGVSDSGNPYEYTSQDTDNGYYIYLPAGTTFYSDCSYKVERWTPGWSWTSPNFNSTGAYTLTTNSFCELSIWNGTLNDDLIITVPDETAHLVEAGTKNELFYDIDCEVVSKKLENSDDSAVNYIFITDLHTGAYLTKVDGVYKGYEAEDAVDLRESRLNRQMQAVVDMANEDENIDFIVIGGDIVNGYETPDSPMYQAALEAGEVSSVREYVIAQMHGVLDPLKQSTKPVFILMGNHDDNGGQSIYYNAINAGYSKVAAEVISDRDWNEGIIKEYVADGIVRDSTYLDPYTNEEVSKYYYYDLEKKGETTRIICLDIFDHRYAYNESGETTSLTTETSGMGYSSYQLKWLADVALKDFDGNILFFSHTGIDYETAGGKNGDVLRAIIAAYQNKTAYSNENLGISVDFSDRGEGSIMSWQAGHRHSETTYYTADANLWQIISGTASVKGGNDTASTSPNVVWRYLTRAWRTEYEACFDVMSATPEVVYKYNVGAGNDDKLLYPELP